MRTLLLFLLQMINRQFGTTRTVYLVGRYAIKVPVFNNWNLFLHGLLANMQEAAFSGLKWSQLCPVLFSIRGGWLIVMQRAEPLTIEEFSELDYAEYIKGGKDLPKGEWIIPVEDKLSSFGKLDGNIVAVDYGS